MPGLVLDVGNPPGVGRRGDLEPGGTGIFGDVVLGEGLRIFGAFASVTGLLAFGLSTAFMVALFTQVFKEELIS